jgi:phosphoglycolate phosphatase-like HAD superfamily hydrolase
MKSVSVVITDMDNTLYDWFEMWYASFSTLLNGLAHKSGIDQSVLEKEIRKIHQRHGTSEYAFLIQELPMLWQGGNSLSTLEYYKDVIRASRSARKRHFRLFPGVKTTLAKLKRKGCLIVAFTESMSYYTNPRIKLLGLDGLIDYVYTPPDHELAVDYLTSKDAESWSGNYDLEKTIVRNISVGARKPDPDVLLDILHNIGVEQAHTIYVGDSLMKDVAMAQSANVTDVWAAYGVAVERKAYELLRRVSHWTEQDVQREQLISHGKSVEATFVLRKSFDELLELFEFIPFVRK